MDQTMTEVPSLSQAARTLAFGCDYAAKRDDTGFNAFDADFGHKLAALPEDRWSPKMAAAAHKMLRKYRRQLANAGIAFDRIPVPPDPATVKPPPAAPGARKPGKLIGLAAGKFELSFPYDPAIVQAVKMLKVRHWEGGRKVWTVPADMDGIAAVAGLAHTHGFTLAPAAADLIETSIEAVRLQQEKVRTLQAGSSAADAAPLDIPGMVGTLFGFQNAGVRYVGLADWRAIIADQMGLGKTMQGIAVLLEANAFPALVVCPATVKINWYRQIRKWAPGKSVEILDAGRRPISYTADIYIANYDILRPSDAYLDGLKGKKPTVGKRPKVDHVAALKKIGLQAMVLDESHNIKTGKTLRTLALFDLVDSCQPKVRLLLSGTPLLNRPVELVPQLQFIGRMDELFGSAWKYKQRFCAQYHNGYGTDASGASNLEELNQIMRGSCYVRRLAKDVLQDMPAKTRIMMPLEIDNRAEYQKAEDDLVEWLGAQAERDRVFLLSIADLLDGTDEGLEAHQAAIRSHRSSTEERARNAEHLIRFTALKKLAAHGKLAAAKLWIHDLLDSGEKLIVFAHHTDIVKEIASAFGARTIMGETSLKERQAAIDDFRVNDRARLLVLNIAAGGTGIDGLQTAASNLAFIELGWTPAVHDQAEGRLDRMGQTEPVKAFYLLAERTIDEEIANLIDLKRVVVDKATDGHADAEVADGILTALKTGLLRKGKSAQAGLL